MSADELRPESWTLHLSGLILPLVLIASNLVGGFWVASGIILALVVYPILDIVSGPSKKNNRPAAGDGRPYEVLLVLHVLLHLVVLTTLIWRVSNAGIGWISLLAALSTGVSAGASGIITAHELGHRKPGSLRWRLSRILLWSVHYLHYTTEHNHNHHRSVGTTADPASAPAERGLWVHICQTIPRQFTSAWKIHESKGKRGPHNPVLHGLFIEVWTLISLWTWLGTSVALAWIIQGVFAILLLEYVNYIRHYGLRREKGERQTHMHSWQTEVRWSNWTLLSVTLHPAHHMKASLPFWRLEAYPDAPTLPSGYYGCFWPCVIPPVWKRWMRPRLKYYGY
uniref:Putative oxidoreductase n=1 Tax=uncultured marine group II/III euryarchaeote KM3_109_G01 TaxID=1457850 RepID=A0A075GCH7_9EURY|nr:putative oxidoreductase [uncultured marine group II/III euryarchaeote KM3_109_G01]